MNKLVKNLLGGIMMAGITIPALTSCDDSFIFDDRTDCHPGINLRFVYDYHMEPGANAFMSNVDCVTVFVLDTEGNYITQFSETSDILLKSESYRMHLPLDEGEYKLLVYGGLTCDHPTFGFTPGWFTKADGLHRDDIRVSLPLASDDLGKPFSNVRLHDIDERWGGLFYGTLDITIDEFDWTTDFREETVFMMKDNNNIQVILQELSVPDKMDVNDFDFKIYDDNFVLDGYNQKVGVVTDSYEPYYAPYATETRETGWTQAAASEGQPPTVDNTRIVKVACAEFQTSRLLMENVSTARLVVTSKTMKDDNGNDKVVIDMPLITYLATTKGFGNNWIRPDSEWNHGITGHEDIYQQYLDRQSNWTLFFFLQRNEWVKTHIIVNDWTVRVNNIKF